MLEAMHLPVDLICNSAELGVEKPDPQFFAAVVELAGVPAAQIAYVGDRYDNDVQPVRLAGMLPILIRRGPWGFLHAQQFAAVDPDLLIIDSLTELPELLRLSHQKN
jgi:FMN phosphatase YigB (HAD superfamily)